VSEPIQPITEKPRRPLRPLQGIPDPETRGPAGVIVSSLFHALLILALVLPTLIARQLAAPDSQGAGGAGASGGGGGGTRGSGGEIRQERVRFLHFVAPPAPAPPSPTAIPTPTPIPPPPQPEPKPEASVAAPTAEQATAAPSAATPGTGGGSGNDGSAGSGPGSGGGVGSGVGTGRGSGTGPGTGGGGDGIYPPTVTNLAILPIPVPNRVRPYKLVAQFEVDERGNARLLAFNPTRDSGYNRKIREMLGEVRFRPATRASDGTAVKDTAYITAEAP